MNKEFPPSENGRNKNALNRKKQLQYNVKPKSERDRKPRLRLKKPKKALSPPRKEDEALGEEYVDGVVSFFYSVSISHSPLP
jgi:hypothetical protein